MEKVNLAEKFSAFNDYFNPRITGELNGQQVKLVKLKGEFIWHHHDNGDELFYVVKGNFDMHFRDKIVTINEGEFIIVPHGTEHKPVVEKEVEILLFEPAATLISRPLKSHFRFFKNKYWCYIHFKLFK